MATSRLHVPLDAPRTFYDILTALKALGHVMLCYPRLQRGSTELQREHNLSAARGRCLCPPQPHEAACAPRPGMRQRLWRCTEYWRQQPSPGRRGQNDDSGNYKPVNLTVSWEAGTKNMEQILLHFWAHKEKVIGNSQHGFTRGKSCLTNPAACYDKMTGLVEQWMSFTLNLASFLTWYPTAFS
ncbi:LOW QUALITY PROTEIN: hypothetical protein QYF61_025650 [Mycteria americana]|uniref:Reverse transcriptase domain-containing protein n=1 Tax=Mycteria americana TaxID=33587 RepID=A0AAN7NWA1_MYCAM|nr:LOW QUALITY PROTEIN: hypothetical protein QYF61_025650 [Mycteria americana]